MRRTLRRAAALFMTLVVMVAAIPAMPLYIASAQEMEQAVETFAISLLPTDVEWVYGNTDSNGYDIAVTQNSNGGWQFSSSGGWPDAYWYTNTVYVDDYTAGISLSYDFTVESGGTNVLLYINGMDPIGSGERGVNYISLNTVIDPSTELGNGSVGDLPAGHYSGTLQISQLGLSSSEFSISAIKVFAVGGTTTVNKLCVNRPAFGYEENYDGTVTITDYYGTATDIVFPSSIGGKTVTEVLLEDLWDATTITIPATVTSFDI